MKLVIILPVVELNKSDFINIKIQAKNKFLSKPKNHTRSNYIFRYWISIILKFNKTFTILK